jgi:hypothetical protein
MKNCAMYNAANIKGGLAALEKSSRFHCTWDTRSVWTNFESYCLQQQQEGVIPPKIAFDRFANLPLDIQRGLMKQWDIFPKKKEHNGDVLKTPEVDMAIVQSPPRKAYSSPLTERSSSPPPRGTSPSSPLHSPRVKNASKADHEYYPGDTARPSRCQSEEPIRNTSCYVCGAQKKAEFPGGLSWWLPCKILDGAMYCGFDCRDAYAAVTKLKAPTVRRELAEALSVFHHFKKSTKWKDATGLLRGVVRLQQLQHMELRRQRGSDSSFSKWWGMQTHKHTIIQVKEILTANKEGYGYLPTSTSRRDVWALRESRISPTQA